MTSTDRAFITAFRREANPIALPTKIATSLTPQALPGVGVEVVSFAEPEKSQPSKSPPLVRRHEPILEYGSTAISPPPRKHTLHAAHRSVTPIVTSRRPLSSFARERELREQSDELRPATVLPRLRWPAVCTQLSIEHSEQLASVLEVLGQFPVEGTKILGIAGTAPGAGCTTLTLALARQAARLGRRLAVVEADSHAPCFRQQFGLTCEQGLTELLTAKAELHEVTTYAHEDRVAVIAWGDTSAPAIDGRQRLQLSLAAGHLRFAYDLVLVDLGSLGPTNPRALDVFAALHGDAALLVAPESCPTKEIEKLQRQLTSTGRPVLGTIENGTPR